MLRIARTALLMSLALPTGAFPALAEPNQKAYYSDSGISGPPYQRIYDALGQLAKRFPGWASVTDYGLSVDGRPLRAIRIASPTARPDRADRRRAAVLITGATHGNEYLNVGDRLPAWILAHDQGDSGVAHFLAGGGILYIVPVVNPDGYEAHTRGNAHGVDLNRDFDLVPAHERHFHETESKALAAFVDHELKAEHAQLKLAVDYHCCDGSLLFPWAYSEAPLPPSDERAHEKVAKLMQHDIDPTYNYGPTGQVLGYLPRGTSKDYYYAKYGALAFTFEGSYQDEAQRFAKHAIFWDHVLGQVAAGALRPKKQHSEI